MKKLLLASWVIVFIAACGPIEEEQTTEKGGETTPNTAPTLSGLLTYEAKASTETLIVLTGADSENDTLSLTIADKPSWLDFSIDNQQIKMTLSPDFFDIGDHTLQLELSDGKLSNSYTLNLDVVDNPSKWQSLQLTDADLQGRWLDAQSQTQYMFANNGLGVVNDGQQLYLSSYINQLPLSLSLYNYRHCVITECASTTDLTLNIIARKENRIRVELLSTNAPTKIIELEKQTNNFETNNLVYFHLEDKQRAYQELNKLDFSGVSKSQFSVLLHDLNNTKSKQTVLVNGQFNQGTTESLTHSSESIYVSFSYLDGEQLLELKPNIEKVVLMSQHLSHLVLETHYRYQLITDLQGLAIDDFDGLAHFLRPQTQLSGYKQAIKIETPELNSEKTYSGRLIANSNVSESGYQYLGGASLFTFNGENSGTTTLTSADGNWSKSVDYSYTQEQDSLKITLFDKQTDHGFYTMASGAKGITLDFENQEAGLTWQHVYAFEEVDLNETEFDYLGRFYDHDLVSYIEITNDGNAYVGSTRQTTQFNYFADVDNSLGVRLIHNVSCPDATDFQSCYQQIRDNSPEAILIRHYKVLRSDNNKHLAQYDLQYGMTTYQSLRKLTRLN